MRTFKQFELGDTKYTLSFDRFTDVRSNSRFKAILKITNNKFSKNTLLLICKPGALLGEWSLYIGNYSTVVTGEYKSKEAKRLILNYLLNERR